MAKLAVLFFAALAFQAAFGGIPMGLRYEDNTLGDLKLYGQRDLIYGKYDNVFGELETCFRDIEMYLTKTLTTDDRILFKTLVWQCREFVQYIDVLIRKLQTVATKCEGEIGMVLREVIEDLRQVQMTLVRLTETTTVAAVDEIKTLYLISIKNFFVQIQKLWRLVETNVDFPTTLQMLLKDIVFDCLHFCKNFCTNFQYFGTYGEQSQTDLVLEVKEVTRGLIQCLQGYDYVNTYQLKTALVNYIRLIETILVRMRDVETQFTTVEVNAVFQQLFRQLQHVCYVVKQIVDGDVVGKVDFIKIELIKDLEIICECFEQLVQNVHIGPYQTLIREILGDYCYAIKNLRYVVQPGYKDIWGLEGFWGKYGYNKFDSLYKFDDLKMRTGLTTWGMDIKDLKIKCDQVIRDLLMTLETITVDDVTTKQVLIRYIREYTRELEMLVQWLEQVLCKTDIVMCKEIVEELKEIIVLCERFCTMEYTAISTVELKEKCILCFRKFFTTFDKLFFGIDIERTLIKEVLLRFLNVTYQFCLRIQHIRVITYDKDLRFGHMLTGMGMMDMKTPVEMYQRIHLIVKDLCMKLQGTTTLNRELLTMQVSRFVQLIKEIIVRLEGCEEELVREVIVELREICTVLDKLTLYNVFTNVQQLKVEFCNCMEVVLCQLEKLLMIVREDLRGDFHFVIKTVFDLFCNGIQDICYKLDIVYNTYNTKVYGFDKDMFYNKDLFLTKNFLGMNKYGKGMLATKYNKDFLGTDKYSKDMLFTKYNKDILNKDMFLNKNIYGYGKLYNKYDTINYDNSLYNKDIFRAY